VYVAAKTLEGASFHFRLHALDLATGAEQLGGPVDVTATTSGSGAGSVAGVITFDPKLEHNRVGLTLAGGVVYLAFASHCDFGNYHGWILGYDAHTLAQVANLNLTPNGKQAGIWQSGGGLSVDEDGDLYAVTGNGTFDGIGATPQSFGDSVVKLHPSAAGLSIIDWFTPYNQDYLQQNDLDLGTDAPVLLPGTHRVIAGSKQGIFYLLDRAQLGHYHAGDDSQIVQSFVGGKGHIHGTPVFFADGSGARLYAWSEGDHLNAYQFDGLFAPTASARSTMAAPPGMPGAFLSLSSDGGKPGTSILWASHPYDADANQMIVSGIVRAFDADDISRELWDSHQATARDDIGLFAKFTSPTVANGRVYVASFSGQLAVYGLLPAPAPLPTPWKQADVGLVGVAGLATFDAASGTFSVRGAGTNLGGLADAARYAYFATTGDVDLSARLATQEPVNAGAQAGLVIRELLDPASRAAAVVVSPNGTISLVTRTVGGAAASVVTSAATVTLPVFVRLARKGATVSASWSSDGAVWQPVGSATVALGNAVDVGFAVNAAANVTTSTATFDEMTLQ
jgi:regulation of enolase protein 1 (concanavalin A-like superfamily)